MNQKEFLQNLEETYKKCLQTSKKKNDDYAESDDPFANFKRSEVVDVPVSRGILVRLMDKIARVSNCLDDEVQVEDERVEDTILDAINYLAILKAWRDNKQ